MKKAEISTSNQCSICCCIHIKMSYKTDYKIEGFLNMLFRHWKCFWWQDDVESVDYTNKSAFSWISVIRLPDFISKADFD